MNKKIVWCISGGECFLKEVLEFVKTLGPTHVKLFISKAGLEVIEFFDYKSLINMPYIVEQTASGLELLSVLRGNIAKVVVAPCTSNTVAKLAHGIADSLCTNLVAQAQKAGTEVFVLPTDIQDSMVFKTKSRKEVHLKRRTVDRENIEKLRRMELFRVFDSPEALKREILSEIA